MDIDTQLITLVSACTALVASIAGPAVTLTVARRQISANVVSVNRQRWIETLRDLVAELIALIATGMMVRLERARDSKSVGALFTSDPLMIQKVERIVMVRNKIRLLTNPNEDDHRQLLDAIDVAFRYLSSDLTSAASDDVAGMLEPRIDAITRCAQAILKREWTRVKRGD
jgi:hypothetical protein